MNDCAKINDGMPLEHTPVAKCVQFWIVTGGLIDRPEPRRLLTQIDTLEFSKWQYKTIDQLPCWFDVFDVSWTCFACRGMSSKHAFFVILLVAIKNARMNVLMVRTGIYLLLSSCAKIFC